MLSKRETNLGETLQKGTDNVLSYVALGLFGMPRDIFMEKVGRQRNGEWPLKDGVDMPEKEAIRPAALRGSMLANHYWMLLRNRLDL